MGALRVVVRIGILWVVSLLVSFTGMVVAHRIVIATERHEAAPAMRETASTVWVGDEPAGRRAPATQF
jgi:hypothetical protein